MIVVDASVGVKWYQPEPGSDAADKLLLDHPGAIHAPDLFTVEVSAALVRHANIHKPARNAMNDAVAGLRQRIGEGWITTHRTPTTAVMSAAALAMSVGHPLKDCIYLVLAQELDCALITADRRFADKARSVYPRIEQLGEI